MKRRALGWKLAPAVATLPGGRLGGRKAPRGLRLHRPAPFSHGEDPSRRAGFRHWAPQGQGCAWLPVSLGYEFTAAYSPWAKSWAAPSSRPALGQLRIDVLARGVQRRASLGTAPSGDRPEGGLLGLQDGFTYSVVFCIEEPHCTVKDSGNSKRLEVLFIRLPAVSLCSPVLTRFICKTRKQCLARLGPGGVWLCRGRRCPMPGTQLCQ